MSRAPTRDSVGFMNFRRPLLALTLGLTSLLAACGGDDSSTAASGGGSPSGTSTATGTGGAGTGGAGGDGGMGTGGMVAFALTSPAFVEGEEIPAKHACTGQNISPELTWTAGPSGTMGYAIVFTDKSNNLIHWVIWDIPTTVTSLPQHVANDANPADPPGSKQVKSYDGSTFGYLGPCPPNKHTYEFEVHAVDVAALPNVTTASSRTAVNAEIMNHVLGSAALSGTFTP